MALFEVPLDVPSAEVWCSLPLVVMSSLIQTAWLAFKALPVLNVPSCTILIQLQHQPFAAGVRGAQQHKAMTVSLCA